MKKLDKYLVKQFIQSILFGLLAFTFIFIIIDLMENLDDFIDENVPTTIIVAYYFYFIPEIIRLMIPVATLLSCMFVVGKLSNTNEMTIIKSGGISLSRFMTPFVVLSLLITIFSIGFGGWIVPYSNREKIFIERTYLKREIYTLGSNLFFQDAPERIIHTGFFDERTNTISRAGIQFFDKTNHTKLLRRIDFDKLRYDSTEKIWIGSRAVKRLFSSDTTEIIESFDTLRINYLNFNPEELIVKIRKVEEYTLSDLFRIMEEQRRAGNDVTRLSIDIHTIFSFSFASIIVVFFGVPLMVDKRRGGIAFQFGINIFVTFIYLAFQQIIKAFGKNGSLDPVLTAWMPNLLFLVLAIINLIRIKK